MEFMDDGQPCSGEVWSPGPIARSVWVLVDQPDGTREPVAVKLGTGKRLARRIEWRWVRPYGHGLDLAFRQTSYWANHVDVPALNAKDWWEAVGDQLTLAA